MPSSHSMVLHDISGQGWRANSAKRRKLLNRDPEWKGTVTLQRLWVLGDGARSTRKLPSILYLSFFQLFLILNVFLFILLYFIHCYSVTCKS